jgi:hypothetical protein
MPLDDLSPEALALIGNVKYRTSAKLLTPTYAELIARQGKTKTGAISRANLNHAERVILDRGPRGKDRSVEDQIAKHEKYVISMLRRPAGSPRGADSEPYRAAKAHGHLVKVSNLKASIGAYETPYEAMDRLGLTEVERERLGEFTFTWS